MAEDWRCQQFLCAIITESIFLAPDLTVTTSLTLFCHPRSRSPRHPKLKRILSEDDVYDSWRFQHHVVPGLEHEPCILQLGADRADAENGWSVRAVEPRCRSGEQSNARAMQRGSINGSGPAERDCEQRNAGGSVELNLQRTKYPYPT